MKRTSAIALAALLIASPAVAKHGHDRKYEICYLQPHDVQIVRDYYESRVRNLPPGLAKKYARSGELPPGWQRRVRALPASLEQQLVVLPPGYQRGYVDGSVVVYAARTHVVLDAVTVIGR